MEIDASVYPDSEPPSEPWTEEQMADYVHRICSAFDFGIPPGGQTIRLFSAWRRIFDRHVLSHSPAYHAFRAFYGWPPVERLRPLAEPGYVKLDAAEGREDPFADRV